MRRLATIRRINDINPIDGADSIECASVGGWKVVVKKGEFKIGQLATYFEIDSWIPENIAPFLCKDARKYNDVSGARLRTVKLRGQISQGLLLPCAHDCKEGDDVTEALGIQKYEPPIPAQLSGMAIGNFPGFIQKTDQERIQNLGIELQEWNQQDFFWEVTEKLDGSSMTAYLYQDEFGVCSRNLNLKEDEKNSFWRIARENKLEEKLRALGRNLALQGELIGEGIQKNRYGINGQNFYLFDIYDIDNGCYLSADDRQSLAKILNIKHCPILGKFSLRNTCMEELLVIAEGESRLKSVEREGIVWKCLSGKYSFKVISNKFLLSEK